MKQASVSESRFENASRNIFFSSISQVIAMILDIVCRRIFLQYIAIEYLGLSSTFTSVLNILSFAELGIGSAIIFSLYEPIKNHNDVKIRSLMKLYKHVYYIVGAFIIVAGLSLTPFLNVLVKEIPDVPHVTLVYIMLVFQTGLQYLFSYKINFLNATQQNYIFQKVHIIANVCKATLQIISIILFKNYFIYLGIAIASTLFVDIFCSIYVSKKYPFLKGKASKLEKEELTKIKKNVFALFLYKVANTVNTTIDTIIISKMLGVVPAAIYANYALIITYSGVFFNNVLGTITPSIGNLMVNSTNEKKHTFFRSLRSSYYWISTYFAVGMIVCFNPFISVAFGSQFLLSEAFVVALVVSTTLTNFQRPCSLMRDANGLFWYGKLRPFFMAIINVVASILLTWKFGMIGVVLGTIISELFTFVWYDPYIVYKHVLKNGLKEYFYDYAENWIILIILAITCFSITNNLPISGVLELIVNAIVATIVVNGFFIIYNKQNSNMSEMKTYLKTLKNRFKKSH